ncbi:uncharacterized protein LOC141690618 [Apium graveolens]|uniref:uncharacterized protein LOC141690618 n=1 Tax=Apium graveolens TaxID=4045 RepID=UPI003D79A290
MRAGFIFSIWVLICKLGSYLPSGLSYASWARLSTHEVGSDDSTRGGLRCPYVRWAEVSTREWTVELGQFEVDYKPRTAIKGQALADFLLEFPPHQEVEPGALIVIPRTEEVGLERQNSAPLWSLFVDGASNCDGAGAGIELISPEAHKIRRVTHLAFHATNNDAEYEALINGLKLALEMKVENLNVFSDSMIVVYQINGGYQAKEPRTELYLKCAQRIIARFNEMRLELIPRGQNEGADKLAKLGSRRKSTLLGTVPLDI